MNTSKPKPECTQAAIDPGIQPDSIQESLKKLNALRPTNGKFYLVIEAEDAYTRREEFDTAEEMLARTLELVNTPCHLFAGVGHSFAITRAPYRYLLTPVNRVSLFMLPTLDELEVQADGWMGPPEFKLEIPQSPTRDMGNDGQQDWHESEEAEVPCGAYNPGDVRRPHKDMSDWPHQPAAPAAPADGIDTGDPAMA